MHLRQMGSKEPSYHRISPDITVSFHVIFISFISISQRSQVEITLKAVGAQILITHDDSAQELWHMLMWGDEMLCFSWTGCHSYQNLNSGSPSYMVRTVKGMFVLKFCGFLRFSKWGIDREKLNHKVFTPFKMDGSVLNASSHSQCSYARWCGKTTKQCPRSRTPWEWRH